MTTIEMTNLSIGISSRISHNLTMYTITNRDEFKDVFLSQVSTVLIESDLPDYMITEIINRAMALHKEEISYFNGGSPITSYGGSEVTPDALIGYHCERLSAILMGEE